MSDKKLDPMQEPDESQIADLINMLDSFMEEGGGHMNVICDENGLAGEKVVETYRSADCGRGNMACSVPTLHKGFDDEEFDAEYDDSEAEFNDDEDEL